MSDDTITIEIDGRPLKAAKGAMVIEVADQAGIRIPRFCYHNKLSVAANCRMCLVEVERAPKPLPACATPVADGMKVFTTSPLAHQAQRSVMEFLLINHPLDCPICDQGGECELQDLSMGYGHGVSRFTERKRVVPDKNIGPLIATDMTRCIHCTRCIRFGVEVAGLPELGATGRGEDMRIGTFVERSVDSELSGNMIDVCPVGALTSKPFRFRARGWEMLERSGVAPHDAVGSNLHVHVRRGEALRVVPRANEAVNEVWLSDRDRYSYEGMYAEDRLLRPRVRDDGGAWRETDWDEALDIAAAQLRDALGAGANGDAAGLGVLASPVATTEEHYLMQALARGLGGAHLDHRLRQSDFSDDDTAPAWPWLGTELAELEQVDAALLVGSDLRREQPLAGVRLRKASLAGAAVWALNPYEHDFNFELAGGITAPPHEMEAALAGIARALGEETGGGAPPSDTDRAIAESLNNSERAVILLGSAAGAHPRAARLRRLARAIARRSGARLGYLSDGPNAAGAALTGMLPHRGPGGEPAPKRGLAAAAMLEAGLPAWLLLGVEPELDCANGAAALAALERARAVVALTGYVTPTMERYASVLLPISVFTETSGTYYNAEGRGQTFDAASRAPGEARDGWRVLRVLANRLGLDGFEYEDLDDVRAALASETGASLDRLTPPDNLADSGGDVEAGAAESTSDNAQFWRVGNVPPCAVDPLVRRAPALQQSAGAPPAAVVRLHPDNARALGLAAGAMATVRGVGSDDAPAVRLEVVEDAAVAPGSALIFSGVAPTIELGPAWGRVAIAPAPAAGGDD